MSKEPRKVRITEMTLGGLSYSVDYVNRKKGGRYRAANFNAEMRTLEQVRQWVRDNPKLELVA